MSIATWRKSSYSCANGCVEVAFLNDNVLIRDSKDPGGPVLFFSTAEWAEFLARVKQGGFDLGQEAFGQWMR